MRRFIKISLLIIITLIMSCEGSIFICDDCLDTIPVGAYLKINVNRISRIDPYYHITLYRGKIEDNIIVDERDTYSSYSVWVNLNQEYSALLTQAVDDKVYNAIDATTIKAVSHEDYCEIVCFIIEDNELNLKIKYY